MPRRAQAFFALTTLAAGVHPLGCSRPADCPSGPALAPDSTCPARSEESSTPSESSAPPGPEVEYGGCTDVMGALGDDDVECVYQPGKTELVLWITHGRASEAEIFVDEHRVTPQRDTLAHEPGQGYRVVLGEHAQEVTVTVPEANPWSLRLRDASTLDPDYQAQRQAIAQRAANLQMRLLDEDERALIELDRLIRYTLSRGLLSIALRIAVGTSYFATNSLEQYAVARQVLDSLEPLATRYPEGHAMFSIYRGKASRRRGRQIDAAIHTRTGSQAAMRLRNPELQADGLTEYSMVLASLGYFEAAAHWRSYTLELGREAIPHEVSSLLEVNASINLLLEKAGQPHQDPRKYYEELHERSLPGSPYAWPPKLAIAQLGLAELAMLDGDPKRALRLLDAVDEEQLTDRRRANARDLALQAHLALGSPHDVIASTLRSLEALTSQTLELGVRWGTTVRRGQALEALGRPDDARLAYEASEALLDTLLPLAALGIGGQAVVARHDEGTQRLISLLLQGPWPHAAEAFCVARQAQARQGRLSLLMNGRGPNREPSVLSENVEAYLDAKRSYEELLRRSETLPVDQLERAKKAARQRQRDIQRLALGLLSHQREYEVRPRCDALRARDPGELLLGLYPLGDDLVIFAAGDHGVAHHRRPGLRAEDVDPRDAAVASSLLGPIDDSIRRASSIRVLTDDEASRIPIHALPFDGDSLLGLERPVIYGLELPESVNPRLAAAPSRALVLADNEALDASAAADNAAGALRAMSYEVEPFETDQRRSPEIRRLLPVVDHFYYAGHAYFTIDRDSEGAQGLWPPYPGGAALEPSYLPLDEVAHLEVADILMLDSVPEVTVLMGCATGVTDLRTHTGGQSLASAFVGAGAGVVIASSHTVDAEQAFLLSEGLYHHLATLDVEGPGRWMQAAMQWAQDDERWQTESFADYRVFVP
ncbi:MAG: CHAT domain-containing protein [Myxococcota bacterium]